MALNSGPAAKIVLQMGLGRSTFTEAHYSRSYVDIGNSNFLANALALAAARVALFGDGVVLLRIRLSRTDQPRNIYNMPLIGVVTSVNPVPIFNPVVDADIPNVSVQLRANDGTGHNKNMYLAGIPEGAVEIAGGTAQYVTLTGSLVNAFNTYIAQLQANWSFRVKSPVLPAIQVQTLNILSAPVPGIQIVTNAPLTSQPSTLPFTVNLSGFRRSNSRIPGLSGLYTCVQIAANPTGGAFGYLLSSTELVPVANFAKLGTISVSGYQYAPYFNINVVKAGTRKRGGRAGLALGRSRSRA